MKQLFLLINCFLIIAQFSCKGQPANKTAEAKADTIYTYAAGSYDGIGKYYLGREIAHVMGAAGASWLERAEREKEEGILKVLKAFPVSDSSVVADIGAGTGYYSFKIAPLVKKGKVFAVDIQDEMLAYLNTNIKSNGIKNVTVLKGGGQNPNLPDNSIDLAFMVDVYHELEFPYQMLQNLRKALRPGGRILLLEYKGEDPSIPIKPLHKMTVAQATKELKANGFSLLQTNVQLPIQHFLLFQKN